MNVDKPHWQYSQALSLKGSERWEVYQRLQELEIICSCQSHQPLQVNIHTPTDLILLWSVSRRICSDRSDLLCWLNRCWSSCLTSTTAKEIQ